MKNQDLIDTAQEATIRLGAATLERITDEELRKRAASALHTAGDRATDVAHDIGSRASDAAHDLGELLQDRIGDHSASDVADSIADAATTAASAARAAAATAGGFLPAPSAIAATAASIWASPRGKQIMIGTGVGVAAAGTVTYIRRRKARAERDVNIDLTTSEHGVAGWDTPAEAFAGLDGGIDAPTDS